MKLTHKISEFVKYMFGMDDGIVYTKEQECDIVCAFTDLLNKHGEKSKAVNEFRASYRRNKRINSLFDTIIRVQKFLLWKHK